MLNKEEIKKIIPQREPFLMIDEVENYIPGESAIASKIDLGGKVVIISMSIPIISTLLETIIKVLP